MRGDTSVPTASADACLFIASICRRWRDLAKRHVSSLLVKEGRAVSHRDVLNAVAFFPRLTHLHLADLSVESLDDAFLADLASSCPWLRALHVGMLAVNGGPHGSNERVITESGLDNFFRQCAQLEHLSLYSSRVSTLPESFGDLPALKALVLRQLPLLRLPASFTRLASLESLLLVGCKELLELPAGFCCLTALQTLSLACSPTLHLPEDLGALTNLRTFDLQDNRQEQLPSSFTQLVSLTRLELDGLDSLNKLTQLRVRGCCELNEAPRALPLSLQALSFSNNEEVASMLDISALTGLRELCLAFVYATRLEAISAHLPNMEHLELVLEEEAEKSLSLLARLPHLRTLMLTEVGSVSNLVEPGGSALQELQQLNIYTRSERFTELPDAITTLHHLTSLQIHAPKLSSLPYAFGALLRLRKLDLSFCSSLAHFPDSLTQLSCLHELNLCDASIHLLPAGFANLSRLKKLDLDQCEQLEALPGDLCDLRMLDDLNTRSCVNEGGSSGRVLYDFRTSVCRLASAPMSPAPATPWEDLHAPCCRAHRAPATPLQRRTLCGGGCGGGREPTAPARCTCRFRTMPVAAPAVAAPAVAAPAVAAPAVAAPAVAAPAVSAPAVAAPAVAAPAVAASAVGPSLPAVAAAPGAAICRR
ncbi:unnamed protein product [Closterium sp. NIES-65]|nr:unnamed protein product [Closterium sp. NIES-65]